MNEHPIKWKDDDPLWNPRYRKGVTEAMRISVGDKRCGFTKRGIGFEALKRSILKKHSGARMPNSKARTSGEDEATKKALKDGS